MRVSNGAQLVTSCGRWASRPEGYKINNREYLGRPSSNAIHALSLFLKHLPWMISSHALFSTKNHPSLKNDLQQDEDGAVEQLLRRGKPYTNCGATSSRSITKHTIPSPILFPTGYSLLSYLQHCDRNGALAALLVVTSLALSEPLLQRVD